MYEEFVCESVFVRPMYVFGFHDEMTGKEEEEKEEEGKRGLEHHLLT